MMEQFDEAVEVLSAAIAVAGLLVILWGVLRGLWSFVRIEGSTVTRGDVRGREALRRNLGYYFLLGLEFLVAADIVESVVSPTPGHLVALGTLVVIRAVISFTLNWELAQEEKKSSSTQDAKTG